jgi:ribosomal protein S18 acetylase RimI-like enzyme
MLCPHLLAVLGERGCIGAHLTTGSENLPAIALYKKLGFAPRTRTQEERPFWAARASRRERCGDDAGRGGNS